MESNGIQNQKWKWASFDILIKIYVNNEAHNFEMRQPKGFLDFIKNELTCKFCLFCFVFILVKFLLPKRFLVIHSTSFRVAIFHTFFETLLGLSHFKIMCIVINIYFEIQIKRRSISLLVLGSDILRASIMYVYVLVLISIS